MWQITLKDNRASLLCYFKLCESFHSHRSIQTGVTARKRQIWVKIDNFFVPRDREIWRMALKNSRVPLLSYFKLCASFRSHLWIQTGVNVWKPSIWAKIGNFCFYPCDLEIWRMILKNNRTHLLYHTKLCASFHCHMWIQTGVTTWKRLNWVLTSVTLTFDLWPWSFEWTSLLSMVITPAIFMTIPLNFEWRKSVKRLQRYGFRKFGSFHGLHITGVFSVCSQYSYTIHRSLRHLHCLGNVRYCSPRCYHPNDLPSLADGTFPHDDEVKLTGHKRLTFGVD